MLRCSIMVFVLLELASTAHADPPLAVAPFDAAAARRHQEAWAKHIGQPREITGKTGMKLVLIPPGEFMMGSSESAEDIAARFNQTYGEEVIAAHFEHEHPQHQVRITKPFYLAVCPVTRGEFSKFVAESGYKPDSEKSKHPGADAFNPNPTNGERFTFRKENTWRKVGFEQTDQHPVVNVSWHDAMKFCKWLSDKENETYRLPTEAEWEYACRAGTTTRYWSGDDAETLAKVANVADAAFNAKFLAEGYGITASDGYAFTAPVGSFKANPFGLFDMHGNAYQWCADWYSNGYYNESPTDDPTGPDSARDRVIRGGSWHSGPSLVRAANRNGFLPSRPSCDTGFRVVRVP